MTPNPSRPFQPTGRQSFLSQSLTQRNPVMGQLYECALRTFQDNGNPGRIFLAAHSIREMTKDLPKVLDLPILTDHGRMRDKLDQLEACWTRGLASRCHIAGEWSGEIDNTLKRVLRRLEKFLKWRRESEPKLRESAT